MGERHHTNANTDPKGSKRQQKTTKRIQSNSPGERLKGVLDNILFLVLDCLTQLSNPKRFRKSDLPSAHQPIDPSTHQPIQPSTHRPTDPSTSRQSIHSFCPARLATTTDQHGTPRRQTGIADKHDKPRCQTSTASQHGQPNSKLLASLRNDDEVKNPPPAPGCQCCQHRSCLGYCFLSLSWQSDMLPDATSTCFLAIMVFPATGSYQKTFHDWL